MDEFEKRLKRDAAQIRADVPDELRERIDASLRGIEPIRTAPGRSTGTTASLWWASSLTGLLFAASVIVLINWNRSEPETAPPPVTAGTTVPEDPATDPDVTMLDIRTADFTSPLEEELDKLQSDLEKARETVRRELDFTF